MADVCRADRSRSVLAAPAQADPSSDAFLNAVTNAGLGRQHRSGKCGRAGTVRVPDVVRSGPERRRCRGEGRRYHRHVARGSQHVHRACHFVPVPEGGGVDRGRRIADSARAPRFLTDQAFQLRTLRLTAVAAGLAAGMMPHPRGEHVLRPQQLRVDAGLHRRSAYRRIGPRPIMVTARQIESLGCRGSEQNVPFRRPVDAVVAPRGRLGHRRCARTGRRA